MTYGVFINYKHTHKHLAGRIYDFFVTKGAGPFMDDYAMNQDRDYRERLLREVRNAPYFLCLLTEDAVEELCTLNDSSDNEEDIRQPKLYIQRRNNNIKLFQSSHA